MIKPELSKLLGGAANAHTQELLKLSGIAAHAAAPVLARADDTIRAGLTTPDDIHDVIALVADALLEGESAAQRATFLELLAKEGIEQTAIERERRRGGLLIETTERPERQA